LVKGEAFVMAIARQRWRQLHRLLAPVMVLPILLTLVTGSLYQMAVLGGMGAEFLWLKKLHVGEFGILNLTAIYPFLNALGLLGMAISGISLWLGMRRLRSGRS
jgi:energy-coupling factor transporter transmembrane protein EcfT